ncbi:MAG: AAA family ATPase [Acidimicrobiia bacterium]
MDGTVAVNRERQRLRRLRKLAGVLAVITVWMWWRIANGERPWPSFPQLSDEALFWLPGIIIVGLLAVVMVVPMLGNSRSPHVIFRSEQLTTSFADVKGLGRVLDEVGHTMQVLLDHETLKNVMGGSPRRGVLFEGPPGTGKTHVAKAMAYEAGVPFLFVSATAFQSMWFGMTARKIRAFFRALRKAARREGGAIGFIEEIDAIGLSRSSGNGMTTTGTKMVDRSVSSGTGGMVNELLIQMQSFDEPTARMKFIGGLKDLVNQFLPEHRRFAKQAAPYANVLLIAATNRAEALDAALLRPGRFDRSLHFGLPGLTGRRELIDYFLGSKAHTADLDTDRVRNELASATLGYSPASLERLFDEALLLALRAERSCLSTEDVHIARLEIEVGLPEPIDYPVDEALTIAVHEAGHATVAHLVGKGRRLEMLSIIKRKEALGFLAHRLIDERHTQRRSELIALIQISLGGMVAEELFFGESGTGPAGDLSAATQVAAEMVGSLGLGGSLVSFRAIDNGPLGGNLVAKVLADDQGRASVERILAENKGEVAHLLAQNRHIVEALQDALLTRHELIGDEILEVIRGAGATRGAVDTLEIIDLREDVPVPST